jgi:hypothetical protein
MLMHLRVLRRPLAGCLFAMAVTAGTVMAQAPRSAALALELSKLLDAGKLDVIAAQGKDADQFVAAMYFPGQLLVVSAKYSVPPLLVEKLQQKAYRDIYMDLNGAGVPESKVFIQDIGADGLKAKAEVADSYERGARTRWAFDGEWRKQKLASEDEYLKNFASADAEYAEILAVLIAKAK